MVKKKEKRKKALTSQMRPERNFLFFFFPSLNSCKDLKEIARKIYFLFKKKKK